MRYLALCFTVVLVATGCSDSPQQPKTSTAGWLDIHAGDERLYGLYLTSSTDSEILDSSGVVLMPWDDRPDISITFDAGDTVVTIDGRVHRFPGRPVLRWSPAGISVVKDDLPLDIFESRAEVDRVVSESLNDRQP
ncbi:hypothetical protein [Pseudobythopirellula maris]|uniref:hypothetical protein n=1 Tax=Pseudobythopirellula maris TaxID=2527991 RepID=UPI0011B414CD|nr:hypothetical protein [Pseudobythopirellula maris]